MIDISVKNLTKFFVIGENLLENLKGKGLRLTGFAKGYSHENDQLRQLVYGGNELVQQR